MGRVRKYKGKQNGERIDKSKIATINSAPLETLSDQFNFKTVQKFVFKLTRTSASPLASDHKPLITRMFFVFVTRKYCSNIEEKIF